MKKSILIIILVLGYIHFGLAQNMTWGVNNSFILHEQTIFPGENYMYSNIPDHSEITSIDRLLSATTSAYVKVSNISEFSSSPGGVTLNSPPSTLNLSISLVPVSTSEITLERDKFTLLVRPGRGSIGGTTYYSIVAFKGTSLSSSTVATVNNLTLTDIVNAEVMIEKVGVSTINFKYNGTIFGTTVIADPSVDYNLYFDTPTGPYFGFKYDFQGFDFSPLYYPCITGSANSDKNWISNCSYDINGNIKVSGISYSDELGRLLQTQGFDLKTGKRWISEIQYDQQGRPAFATSSSPANLLGLEYTYKTDFIKKVNGIAYTNSDWENIIPQAVGSQEESLGWYYSTNNTSEPFQDITDYPFIRTTYSNLNPGATQKIEGGRQLDNNIPQGFSYTVPATQELYYVFGSDAFQGETAVEGKEVILKASKTVSIDEKGNENVKFTDAEGKTLASARSGGTVNYDVVALIGEQGYIDVHIPKNITNSQISFENSNIGDYTIYNLRTETIVTSMTGGNFYRLVLNNASSENKSYITSAGTIVSDANSKGIRYPVNYYDYALSYYDDAGMLVKSTQPLGFNASCLTTIQANPTHSLESTFTYNALGEIVTSTSPDNGIATFKYRADGQIRFSQNSKQALVNEFSYTNYDNLGRSIESGVAQGNFSTVDADIDVFSATNYKEQNFVTYDEVNTSELSSLNIDYQSPSFLSGNVAKTQNDQTTTYYSYDIYGRVKWVVQNITDLGFKTIDYEYDPITSAISKTVYQKHDANEQFIHRYTYNSVDNSLVKVETSTDDIIYTEHAVYEYYETGQLKNIQLAEGIQQIDYVYTLGGQLKSINHPSLSSIDDPGGSANDMFGMTIDYFTNDYQRTNSFPTVTTGTNQYNGNIKGITWNVDQDAGENPLQYSYEYNRENWLTEANFNGNGNINTTIPQNITIDTTADPDQTVAASSSINFLPGAQVTAVTGTEFNAVINTNTAAGNYESTDYQVSNITYDANGNIKTLDRNKNTQGGSNKMDELSYVYNTNKPNQLKQITDAVTVITNANDIKTQTNPDNYEYNEIGQLIRNNGEDISYTYNAKGLVTEIKKILTDELIVKFYYNDKNHRVKKESFSNGILQTTTHYIRNTFGIPLAIYENSTLVEHTIYGNTTLGIHYRASDTNAYQLTDHLGNVRAVILRNGTNAVSLTAKTDYYPFGMPMPNRHVGDGYRYAYQGQEKDPETNMEAFELRLWDSRIGRWLTTDPYNQFHSPYLGMGNNPINGIDPDGGKFFDWYEILDSDGNETGRIVWLDGNEEHDGFKHLSYWYRETDTYNNTYVYDPITKGVYYSGWLSNGEYVQNMMTESFDGWLDVVLIEADTRSTGEKIDDYVRGIENAVIRTTSKLTNIVGSQINVWWHEGFHPGRAYNAEHYLWEHYWELDENRKYVKIHLRDSKDIETALDPVVILTSIPGGFTYNLTGKAIQDFILNKTINATILETIRTIHSNYNEK
ncbi:RHS repeat-associated core domain protein [Kordia sp. SMS9]|uniref:RHS repeat domain-containing protein n=1 Tax=Kordia sp. SMS9 TaxID=2282170 RepID=UPI000E100906|nr:RHS repeat-associated core domain-containing protein [Kordia sp. SMS9]AXG69193.1 RHS repeat-associated core domain protein [Kordia sp. SMS9]